MYIKTILGGAIKLFDSKEILEILLEYNGVRENIEDLFEIISELKKMQYFYLEEPNQIHDLLYHSIFCMEGIKNNKIYLKLAALLHDIGKLETKKYQCGISGHKAVYYNHEQKSIEKTEKILKEIGFEEKEILKVTTLIKWHDKTWDNKIPTKKQLNNFLEKLNICGVTFEDYFNIRRANIMAHNPDYIQKELKDLISVLDAYLEYKLENMNHEEALSRRKEMGIMYVDIENIDITQYDIQNDSLLRNIHSAYIDYVMKEALNFANGNYGLNNNKQLIFGHLYKWYFENKNNLC